MNTASSVYFVSQQDAEVLVLLILLATIPASLTTDRATTSAMVKPADKTINLAFEHKLAKVTVQITEFTSQLVSLHVYVVV